MASRPNSLASLIALSAENATTRFPSGTPSVAAGATVGNTKMTGATHAGQTTATKFSRSFSLPRTTPNRVPNRVPRVDVLSAMTFGTALRNMNVIMMVRRAEKRVTMPGGTATDAKTMAGKLRHHTEL